MKTILELFKFVIKRKKFWLIPFLIVIILIGSLLIATQGSVIAPFIYTVF
jgi:hypothetical protein